MATYKISGMSCEGCVRAVDNALQAALPGVERRIDLAAGTVWLAADADEGRVREAIEDAGFEFGGELA